jgi:hypothetical protein
MSLLPMSSGIKIRMERELIRKGIINFDSHKPSHGKMQRPRPEIRHSFADGFAIVEWIDGWLALIYNTIPIFAFAA